MPRLPLFASLKQFSKIDDENTAKHVFRHDEHLRQLHIPSFAFLKHFSKIDDENSAKTRFTACWTVATTADAFIRVSRANFKN